MSPLYIKEWVRKAEADRLAAQRALRDTRRRKDQAEIACFHAQQCAEKYLKAVLAFRGKPAPRTHDLLALAKMLEDCGTSIEEMKDGFRELNRYAVEIRYPGETTTLREAADAVLHMERTAVFAAKILSKYQKDSGHPR